MVLLHLCSDDRPTPILYLKETCLSCQHHSPLLINRQELKRPHETHPNPVGYLLMEPLCGQYKSWQVPLEVGGRTGNVSPCKSQTKPSLRFVRKLGMAQLGPSTVPLPLSPPVALPALARVGSPPGADPPSEVVLAYQHVRAE